jgi:uncharacterized membrane protein YwzB
VLLAERNIDGYRLQGMTIDVLVAKAGVDQARVLLIGELADD